MKSLLLIPAFAVIAALTGCNDQPTPVTTSPSSTPSTSPSPMPATTPMNSSDPVTNPPTSGTSSMVK